MNTTPGFLYVYRDGGKRFSLTPHNQALHVLNLACQQIAVGQPIISISRATRPCKVHTGLKGYDARINSHLYFMTGNVCSNFQTSTFVRAPSQTECNGKVNEPGHLTAFDLQQFKAQGLGDLLSWYARFHAEYPDQETIAYVLRDMGRNRKIHYRGWIVTSTSHKLIARCTRGAGTPGYRFNEAVVKHAMDWLTHDNVQSEEVLLQLNERGEVEVSQTDLIPQLQEGTPSLRFNRIKG